MKHIPRLFIVLLLPVWAQAQYFYKDVLGTRQSNELNKLMKRAKVTAVHVKNFNFDDSEIEDFLCEQTTENNCRYVVTITGTPLMGENHLHSWFNNLSQITKSTDSTATTTIQNLYEYDAAGRLKQITITSYEQATPRERLIEQHQWLYNAKGGPEKLYVIKQATDTITVLFKNDTSGLPTEEISYKKGREKERIYYYYDVQHRLTDIVRYNELVSRLLPEHIFEYNESGQVSKQVNVTPGASDYQNWFYKYDANGLKTEERCYLKGNMFRGKLVYTYEYNRD